jgi:hypothetical protein
VRALKGKSLRCRFTMTPSALNAGPNSEVGMEAAPVSVADVSTVASDRDYLRVGGRVGGTARMLASTARYARVGRGLVPA